MWELCLSDEDARRTIALVIPPKVKPLRHFASDVDREEASRRCLTQVMHGRSLNFRSSMKAHPLLSRVRATALKICERGGVDVFTWRRARSSAVDWRLTQNVIGPIVDPGNIIYSLVYATWNLDHRFISVAWDVELTFQEQTQGVAPGKIKMWHPNGCIILWEHDDPPPPPLLARSLPPSI